MKISKKFVALLLVVVSVMFVVIPTISADSSVSDIEYIYHNGSYSYTCYQADITFPNYWNKTRVVGTSKTQWQGTNPYYADSILHQNIVTCSCLGGLSVSGGGGGISVNDNTMIDAMSIDDDYKINSSFDYQLTASIYMFSTDFHTLGRVQIGSNFYTVMTE